MLDDGSAILTGFFSGTATFGSTTLTSAGGADVFVAKVDAAGAFVWATQAGGAGSVWGTGVSTLADGSAIVTGNFDGSATFGSTTFTSAGNNDVFIAKVDAAGAFVWATQAGGADYDNVNSISTFADGSAILTGDFQGSATFGSTTFTSAGNNDVFVAKVDAAGAFAWATRAGGTGYDYGYGVSVLADGSAILAGTFQGSAAFGSTTLTSAGRDDIFVAKVDAAGAFAWATQAGGTDYDYANSVSALTDGSAILTGTFEGSAAFGATTLTSAGRDDIFVAKVDAAGAFAWATRAGGTDYDYVNSVSTFADGSAILTGNFGGTATFGPATFTSAGNNDIFVATVDAAGAFAWATQAGGTLDDDGRSVSTLTDGSAILTGYFGGSATFGSTTLTSAGSADIFVAKVASEPGAPVGVSAIAGDAQAVVSWTAPSSDGGSPITTYTVTGSPSGSCTATAATTCTVTGLTNGTSYTFTVTATNTVGTSAASSASTAVTPAAPADPTGTTPTPTSTTPTGTLPKTPRAITWKWANSRRTLTARFTTATGTTYLITAKKQGTKKTLRGKCRITKRKATCTIRLNTPARWTISVTPKINKSLGKPATKTILVRTTRSRA